MLGSTVGKRVKFGRKNGGTVKYEVRLEEPYIRGSRDFVDLIQGIDWDNGDFGIRICYYVKNHNEEDKEWKFANRPLTISPKLLEELLKRAQKEDWFPKIG